ncbi:hypothetical protein HII17_13335 [Thalassotalea sp. M1531]|uniref:Uncharacterized protein n=1 Tax=Thalassotalea algicola TaxID=2716224 RepID=A0A7Y0LE48_9GAMM|nr:hypothetical protein [Thalassotalea algicola]NMP32543.1 hypothetical protein [Thalassotalea algicola]
MKSLLKLLSLLLATFIVAVFILVYMLVDGQPLTIQQHQVSPAHADNSKRLAKRLYRTLQQPNQQSKIVLTQNEIDGLGAIMHRALPQATLDVTLSEHGTVLLASIELPKPLSGQFINITATLLPSNSGIELSKVKVGEIVLSGETSLGIVRFLVDKYVGNGATDKLLSTITSVSMSPSQLVVSLNIDSSLLDKDNDGSLFNKLRDELALFGDKKLIKYYYSELLSFAGRAPNNMPLHHFIRHLFHRTIVDNQTRQPTSYVEQNKALLVALTLYFGHDRLTMLVGDIEPLNRQQKRLQYIHRRNVRLAGRNDLQQHFIYSIALQLLSNVQASDALGEFKELLDTNKGGSGFSFADLMADRAGTRLAMIATYSEQQAKDIQILLASIDDKTLLPTIENLAEGINESEFNRQFEGVGSKSYQQMLGLIDDRLKTLPLYQFNWR